MIDREPAPGLREDGTLVVLKPGEPIPQPKIIMPSGEVLTPAEFAAAEADDPLSDLDDEVEAALGGGE